MSFNIHSSPDEERARKWEDYKDRQISRGKFTPEEVKLLLDRVCDYAHQHQLKEEELRALCESASDDKVRGAWCVIAEALPKRSVQACHNLVKRKFNSNNYLGAWRHWEELELANAVRALGQRWKEIGESLGRTAGNVRDKWRQMGGN